MLNQNVPPLANVGEITNQDQQRQEFEQDLSRSNWRYFFEVQEQSPTRGTGRRDDKTAPTR